jgi:hypothetical protein
MTVVLSIAGDRVWIEILESSCQMRRVNSELRRSNAVIKIDDVYEPGFGNAAKGCVHP